MKPITFCRSDTDLLRCGWAEGLTPWTDGLGPASGSAEGRYCSRLYDSGAAGMEWNRLHLETLGARVELLVWTGDVPPPYSSPGPQAADWLHENAVLSQTSGDVLLHGLFGRYFQFCAELAFPNGESRLRGYEASFPKQSFVDYLPRIYQGNPVLDRFLGVLQAAYSDTTASVDRFPRQLSPALADGEALRELARWLGAEEWTEGLPEASSRALVAEAVWLHRRRGTRTALSRFLELVTGEKPVIVEPFEWEGLLKNTQAQARGAVLYGSVGELAVLLREEPPMGEIRLARLLEDFLPTGVRCHLVFLGEERPLGSHSYLGVNTRLSEEEPPKLGGVRLGSIRL